ncbi:MAG: hypothetical protein AAGI23_10010 [Bacteroidota bacterium]
MRKNGNLIAGVLFSMSAIAYALNLDFDNLNNDITGVISSVMLESVR